MVDYRVKLDSLLSNLRFYVLLFSIALSVFIYSYVKINVAGQTLQTIRLQQLYAFTAVIYLYTAVFAAPFTKIFKSFPGREEYLHARRAIGVSAFYFACLHASLVFFGQLGGFSGLGFLGSKYILALILAVIALFILFLMAITSLDWAVEKMTFPRWKLLHRFVYLAGVLILIHSAILGSHFADLSTLIPGTLFVAVLILLMLESVRFEKFLASKFPRFAQIGLVSLFILEALFLGVGYFAAVATNKPGSGGGLGLNVHAQHIQLALQAQNPTGPNPNGISALIGDRTRRYTVSFEHDTVTPNTDTLLRFKVYDANSGASVGAYQQLYTKTAHLVIVDDSLTYYSHIHPQTDSATGDLVINTSFPQPGYYHLYINFQPLGAIEQQFGFNLQVGDNPVAHIANQSVDQQLTKQFGDYAITLASNSYSASKLSIGQQQISFTIKTAKDHAPVTNLKPYLAAFGHLVMVDEQSYNYLHVHPTNAQPPNPNASGGPVVTFLPIGLYGPIKPGTYRIFAQFNPNNQLILADFTVKVNP